MFDLPWIIIGGILSLVITWALVRPSMSIARHVGAVDNPGGRHVHKEPTPRMGGIAIFLGIVASVIIVWFASGAFELSPYTTDIGNANPIVLLIGVSIMFAVGLIDDRYRMRALYKFIGQLIAAAVVASSGLVFQDLLYDETHIMFSFGIWAWPLTVLYIVAFVNVVNLIDGLDGLAAGVCAIAAIAFFILAVWRSNWIAALLSMCVLGACLAFLRFNFHPAKVFMGDCGSLTLGMILAITSIMGAMRISTLTTFAVPIIIAAIPIIDTFAAIVRRKRAHISVSSPDRGHIHHSLLDLGWSQTRVVLTIYAFCGAFAASGIVIAAGSPVMRIVVVAIDLVLAGFIVFALRLFDPVLKRYYPTGRDSLRNQADRPHNPILHNEEQDEEFRKSQDLGGWYRQRANGHKESGHKANVRDESDRNGSKRSGRNKVNVRKSNSRSKGSGRGDAGSRSNGPYGADRDGRGKRTARSSGKGPGATK